MARRASLVAAALVLLTCTRPADDVRSGACRGIESGVIGVVTLSPDIEKGGANPLPTHRPGRPHQALVQAWEGGDVTNGPAARVRTRGDGRFRLELAPGPYRVDGYIPGDLSAEGSVDVYVRSGTCVSVRIVAVAYLP